MEAGLGELSRGGDRSALLMGVATFQCLAASFSDWSLLLLLLLLLLVGDGKRIDDGGEDPSSSHDTRGLFLPIPRSYRLVVEGGGELAGFSLSSLFSSWLVLMTKAFCRA